MNFIWDIVLQAEKNGIKKQDLFFKQAEQYSPYYEPALPAINQQTVDYPLIEINALYRFSRLVQELLHPDTLSGRRYGNIAYFLYYFFDMLMHYLSEIDLRHGVTRREIYIRKLRQQLLAGVFGAVAARGLAAMDRALQLTMAGEVLLVMETGASLFAFRRALRSVFPDVILYQSRYEPDWLPLYLPQAKNTGDQAQLDFLIEGFLPLYFRVQPFWQRHFGILGVDATMILDNIAIF